MNILETWRMLESRPQKSEEAAVQIQFIFCAIH